ncbi:B3 domain-containing protein Os07g0563300-like [Cynara cardunculus var. scolymus]|uniref:B3 domain-containing protein Os07g0563300-like n=1 Tax=Cynara cardunculus var. scolymus TaxID=59895 RepID=UPI000D622FE4|nr:B3 domain-containing protein Os07g0563300-like [Cynara cardunculus var. scolymus]
MTMTMTSHSSSPKLCANTKCKKILQVTRPSWKCPNGCFVRLCDECSLCDSCLNPQRSISPPSWSRPAASFRKRSSEKTSVISTSSIPVRGPAAVQTPCLLNSSNTEPQPQPQVDISVRPTQPSWLGERKNSSVKRSSQIRASHVIKDKTAVGTEHSPSRHLLGSKSFTAQSRHGNDHLLDRYMPKQVTECSDAKITPLFEKKLTASDAGRVGRLVLPKRCAEAYFPPVNEPFGEPLSIQDTEGKNWDLNLRFWPNNNSRMYVLEGFSLVVKSVELVEGDVVTFSRLEPEGKLIMGYRKAKSTALSLKQAIVTVSPRNDVSKGNTSSAAVSQMKPDDPTSNIQSEVVRAKAAGRSKRKSSKMGWGSDINEPEKEMVELDLTSKEAQELVRPPLGGRVPKSVVIDGVEIMGYEDVPVIGRPTIIENLVNKMIQWAQCEGCYKWRKVPMDVVIPAGWTCSHNQWDPHSCNSPTSLVGIATTIANFASVEQDFA